MQIQRRQSGDSGPSAASLSSMIDIIFLLIIFFIVTASFDSVQLDKAVQMPQVSGQTPAKTLPPERIIVNILTNGNVKIGFNEVVASDVEDGIGKIIANKQSNPDAIIIINADARAKHHHVEKVMKSLAKLGYKNARINAEVNESRQTESSLDFLEGL